MKKIPTSRATAAAVRVLDDCGLLDDPLELPIEDIILARGVMEIQKKRIDGAQGRIIFSQGDAIISYNENITHEGKRRFVIAHELGHYELHNGLLSEIHTDDKKSLSEWYATGKHEKEANLFAAEFLMPSHLYMEKTDRRQFSMDLMKEVGNSFNVSITAALLRYRILGDFPIGIVFSSRGKVKWKTFSDDFCLKYIPYDMDVPVNSIAKDFYNGKRLPEEPEQIEAMDWFEDDRDVLEYEGVNFYEQCIQIGNDSVLSCIWND